MKTLPDLTPAERVQHYKELWGGRIVALTDLETPKLCELYEELADEILAHYLSNVTVVVKVWVNYDSVRQKFYLDPQRIDFTGKLYLTEPQRRRLDGLDWHRFQIRTARLRVGTAFRPLALVDVACVPSPSVLPGGNPAVEMRAAYSLVPDHGREHPLIAQLAQAFGAQWHGTQVGAGMVGLTLADLHNLATHFRFEPHTAKEREEMCFV